MASLMLRKALPSPMPVTQWKQEIREISYQGNDGKPEIDFTFGNPHSIIPGLIDILRSTAVPPKHLSKDEQNTYYAYTWSASFTKERECIAQRLNKETPMKPVWRDDGISLTTGAIAGLFVSISLFVNQGDEVIYFAPFWFSYRAMTEVNGGVPKPLNIYGDSNVLSNAEIIQKLENSITKKTKLLILNTPHNPSGVMFNHDELKLLANLLERKSQESGHRIVVILDEAYRDFVYDGNRYCSLAQYYPYSLIVYTYGKILLAPQQRLGWIAISPLLYEKPEFAEINSYFQLYLMLTGWQFPNVIPGKGLVELERLIDTMKAQRGLIQKFQAKRDLIVDTIVNKCSNGYSVTKSKGTFYLLFKPPPEYKMSGYDFCKALIEKENVKLLPGFTCGLPAWIRVTYTAPIEKVREFCNRLVKFDQYLRRKKSAITSKL